MVGTTIYELMQETVLYKIKPRFLSDPNVVMNFVGDLTSPSPEFFDDWCYIATADQILAHRPPCGTFVCRWDDRDIPTNLNINVLYAETDLSLPELSRQIKLMFERVQRLESKKLRLTEACLSKKGIPYLLEVANKIFGNPVFICDTVGSLIHFVSDVPIDEPMCNELQRDKVISHSMFKSALDRNLFVELEKNNNVYLYHGIYCARWFYGIEENKHTVAFLVLNAALHPFAEEDEILFRVLGDLIALEWQRSDVTFNDFSDYRNYAFLHLLEGNDDDPTALIEVEKKLQKKDGEAFRVVVLRYINKNNADPVHNYLQSTLVLAIPNMIMTVFHSDIAIAFLGAISMTDQDVRQMFQLYADNYGLYIGISRSSLEYENLHHCYTQALRAIELGVSLFPDRHVYLYSECSFNDLLKQSQPAIHWKSLCDERLLALVDYDQKHHSKYLQTLASYLDHDCSPKETCEELFIHRNTLRYRLGGIKEITNLDFDNSKMIFQLKVSLEVLRFAGQL